MNVYYYITSSLSLKHFSSNFPIRFVGFVKFYVLYDLLCWRVPHSGVDLFAHQMTHVCWCVEIISLHRFTTWYSANRKMVHFSKNWIRRATLFLPSVRTITTRCSHDRELKSTSYRRTIRYRFRGLIRRINKLNTFDESYCLSRTEIV